MDFNKLVTNIHSAHNLFYNRTINAININLTLRNWLIGYFIVVFEQNGEDKAKYGSNLLDNLSKNAAIKGLSVTNLRLNRQFYIYYPQIYQALFDVLSPDNKHIQSGEIYQALSDDLAMANTYISSVEIRQTLSDDFHLAKYKDNTIPADDFPGVPPHIFITRLSFSHITLLLAVDDPLKRAFYEIECIKGIWSSRELKRQIVTLYYERSGMSSDKLKLSKISNKNVIKYNPEDFIRDPIITEFLGYKSKDVLYESDLEQYLIEHLQEFILELGHGYCFEARQKRIIIGNKYYFIDLVFYHRLLKCHILIDLKVDEFNHEYIGQLNTYLNYYKKEIKLPDDNLPVGILLCTDKSNSLVEYATAGMDNKIFVSKYLIELPKKDELLNFIKKELKNY